MQQQNVQVVRTDSELEPVFADAERDNISKWSVILPRNNDNIRSIRGLFSVIRDGERVVVEPRDDVSTFHRTLLGSPTFHRTPVGIVFPLHPRPGEATPMMGDGKLVVQMSAHKQTNGVLINLVHEQGPPSVVHVAPHRRHPDASASDFMVAYLVPGTPWIGYGQRVDVTREDRERSWKGDVAPWSLDLISCMSAAVYAVGV